MTGVGGDHARNGERAAGLSPEHACRSPVVRPEAGARMRHRSVVRAVDDRPLLMLGSGVVLYSLGPVLVAASSTSGAVLSFWRLGIGAALLGALTLWRGRTSGLRVTRRG